MCHDLIAVLRTVKYYLIILLLVGVFTSLTSIISTSMIFISVINMPVTTRSMTKGGLPNDVSSAPLPVHHPTCSNTITNTADSIETHDTIHHLLSLPDLVNHYTTPSSSEHDSNLESSSDTDFEISNFDNLKILGIMSLPGIPVSNTSQFFSMESDCKEEANSSIPSSSAASNDEILKILTAISSQMVVGHQDLQAQLISSNYFLENELQKIREETEQFKLEMRAEMNAPSNVGHPAGPSISSTSSSDPSLTMVASPLGGLSVSSSSTAFQNQMLAILNDTFTKLSTVISDTSMVLQDTKIAINDSKSSETKTEWSKFSGDPKKFRPWYLAIMAQLSIAPWQSLYDASTNSVVKITSNNILNGKLYAKVIGASEGSALQHMLARKHLRANGILLLQELHQMYKPKCAPEVIVAKTVEFWGHMTRSPSESVDEYYNRFQELLEEINEEVESITTANAIRHFIFTLGDEFLPLQHSFRLGTILDKWKTQNWPSLLVLCRDFYNSVNPKVPTVKRDRDRECDPFSEFQIDRSSHHEKICMWFSNPTKHKHDIALEQQKYSGRCIYHLTKSHTTEDCNIKKECDKVLAAAR
jgi:hypothetical protein